MEHIQKTSPNLLKEGKLKRNLIDGIVEILLLMISILLVFKVNNWNERSKMDTQANNIYKALGEW